MQDNNNTFYNHLAQTTQEPIGLAVESAKGSYIYGKNGKRYLDMICGVAVSNLGHGHPKIVKAIKDQVDRHLHVMVYGEFIQDAENALGEELRKILPSKFDNYYFLNSGTEAVEAALKLVKRATNRTAVIGCHNSYHGSTHGSLSVSGNEKKKNAFRPMVPGAQYIRHNVIDDLTTITENTAGVIVEVIQGDAGIRIASKEWLAALRNRCNETGALLIFDEIQTGIGRTGKNFAFEHYGIEPDIIALGKALGGGMPIGAIAANKTLMELFSHSPILGHITTFGGHPVPCAAGAAALEVLRTEIDYAEVEAKGAYLEKGLQHPIVKEIRRIGLMYAIDLASFEQMKKVADYCLENGVIAFWFLSTNYAFRLSPPLNISYEELDEAIAIIQKGFGLAAEY